MPTIADGGIAERASASRVAAQRIDQKFSGSK